MNMMQAVAAMLWANAGFRAASPGGIMPILLPEGAKLPATTYQIVGGSSKQTFDTSGPAKIRVQFDFHAGDVAGTGGAATVSGYTLATAARNALIAALDRYSGVLADGTWLQNAVSLQPIDYFDNDARRFRCSQEFYLMFNR
jgi:hypothetical protein